MHVTHHATPAGFLHAVRPALEPREAEHNLLLGWALSDAPQADGLYTVEDADGIALASVNMPGRSRVLASSRDDASAAAATLAHALVTGSRTPGEVTGRTDLMEAFSTAWASHPGAEARVLRHELLYALPGPEALTPPASPAPGRLRQATEADAELLVPWWLAFLQEAFPEPKPSPSDAGARAALAAGRLYLWEDAGRPRCMVGWNRPTWTGVSLGPVYTPSDARGHGYASAATAALSTHLLANGRRFCTLFTDADNPTPNALYQRLGYRHVCDFRVDHVS